MVNGMSDSRETDVLIVGGGAAGLFCAFTAGRRGRKVTLLEHQERVGKKILISGGGRCNFTNLHARHDRYLTENPNFCRSAFARFTPADFLQLVEAHSIAYYEKKLGQLFCRTSSKAIVAMLLEECRRASVEIHTSARIIRVEKGERFRVETDRGHWLAQSLVVACGGLSFAKLGASGFGYDLARQFGLTIRPPTPGLVPLTFGQEDRAFANGLSGVSLPVKAIAGKARFHEALLFTHRGVSGPAVLQISSYRDLPGGVSFDLLPDHSPGWLKSQRAGRKTLESLLAELWPRRLAEVWCHRNAPPKPLAQFDQQELQMVENRIAQWQPDIDGTEGYPKAEVTCGGVSTRELLSRTMEARRVPGLYFIGEVVDVTGWLGGYNFQWAWASGHAAGEAV